MKWFVVYMMVTGYASTTETHPASSQQNCQEKGKAWVAQMKESRVKGWSTFPDFECIQLPE